MLAGLVSAPFTILFATLLQEQVPEDMRARVFGLDTTIGVAGMPLGVIVAGLLIEGFGLRFALAVHGIAFVCVALFTLGNPALHNLQRGNDVRASIQAE